MQRRLRIFSKATRAQSERIEWSFYLRTVDGTLWTEAVLAEKGMPPTWVFSIEANANFPYQGKLSRGCFSTHRIIRPRQAAWNILSASESLVADVLAEFSRRLRQNEASCPTRFQSEVNKAASRSGDRLLGDAAFHA